MACRAVGGGGVAQTVRQSVVPGGIFGLQGEQLGDRVVPALWAGAPVGWPPVADDRRWLIGFAARAVAGLAFGVAERVLTFGLSASGHGWSPLRNAIQWEWLEAGRVLILRPPRRCRSRLAH